MSSGQPNTNPLEEAALYAAGALSPSECAEFEKHLQDPKSPWVQALISQAPAIEALVQAAPQRDPLPAVREALLRRIAAERGAERDFFVQRGDDRNWVETGIPGARIRTLFTDTQRRVRTFLLRMEPGCEIPSHPHHDVEECYILEGDLHTTEMDLGPGDYMRAPAGTMHARSFTRTGCLMLVTAGLEEHEMN